MKKEFKLNLLSSNIRHYIWALMAPALVSSGAYAADYVPVYGTVGGKNDIAIGDGSSTDGEKTNIAIGQFAKAGNGGKNNQSIAIGAGGAAGHGAWAKGDQSIAIGGNTIADGNSAIAMGGDDLKAASGERISYVNAQGANASGTIEEAYRNLTGNSLNPGGYQNTTSKTLAIAMGVKTTAKELSLALGTFANAGAVNTVAIGSGAKASLANSIAIGGGAIVDNNNKGTKQTSVTYDGTKYSWAGGDNVADGDVVSFGSSGYERQLKNIAPGEVSKNSTDAINGSQLHSIASSLTERVNKVPVVYTKPDGTKVYKVGNEFYTTPNPSATDQPLSDTDKNNLITSMVNPNGNTINAPTTLANVKGNLANVDDTNNNVTNPDGSTVTGATADKAPTVPADIKKNNAATVGDILNSGFNLQNNGAAKDFVRHGDTINFKDGTNTKVSIENKDKKVSNIVVDIKDEITLKSVTIADGTNKGPKLSKDGIDMNNTPITNISNGLTEYAAGDNKAGLVDLSNKTTTPDSSAATVGDLRNMGWVISSTKTTNATGEATDPAYTDKVQNANEVEFVGTNLAKVSGKTEGNKRTITVDVKLDTTVTDNSTITVNNAGKLEAVTTGLVDDPTQAGKLKPEGNKGTALVTATTLANALNDYGFIAKANSESGAGFKVTRNAELDFIAGDNLTITRTANTGKFTFSVSKTPTFDSVAISNNGPVLSSTGLDMKDKAITNVTNNLAKYNDGTPKKDLVNLDPSATTNVDGKTVATVDNLRNMGWVVSSDKKTGDTGEYSDNVKNANEVKFIGTNLATVSGKTDNNGVRTITVDVNAQNVTNNAQLPVVYTKPDGTKVYKVGNEFYTTPNPSATDQPLSDTDKNNLITSMANPDGNTTNAPTTLANVKGNLAVVDDTNNNVTNPDGTSATGATADKAPTVPANINKNNAATVGDILNSGFNLQNNDAAKDFVRHGDTINFKNGTNTEVSIENKDKKVSNIVVDIKDDITLKSVTIADGDKSGPKLSKGGIDMNNTPITNISNGLTPYDNTDPKKNGLVNLDKSTDPAVTNVDDKTAATVGDLRNMGWVISSNKSTGAAVSETTDTPYNDQVKNANEVEFVGTSLAKVSGKTEGNKRTITVDVKLDKATVTDNKTITVNDDGKLEAVTTELEEDPTQPGKYKPKGTNPTDANKALINAETLANIINDYGFSVKANSKDDNVFKVTRNAVLDFTSANDNLTIAHNKGKFTFTIIDTPSFESVTIKNGGPVLNADGLNMNNKPITNISNGLTTYANTDPKKAGLVNLEPSPAGTTPVDDKTAATVGDLRNMGWVVSSNKTTGDKEGTATDTEYSKQAKNASEVKFIGTGLATVSGKTGNDGIHTITVDVNAQNVTNNAQLPVSYTKPDGTKVYKVGDNFYTTPNPTDQDAPLSEADKKDLVTSMVNPDGTTSTNTTLANVKDNIGLNDQGGEAGQTPGAPLAKIPEEKLNKIGNNAATVNDVMRAGWNAYINAVETKNHMAVVNPTDNVVFKGLNGISVTADAEAGGTTTFKFSLDEGEVATPEFTVDGKKYQKIGDNYYPVDDATGKPNTDDPVKDQTVLDKLKAATPNNKTNNVVTGEQVANAIRESGWNLGKATDDELKATTFSNQAQNTEKVNVNDNVRFANGKGTVVKTGVFDALDANGLKVTTTTVKIDVDLPIAYEAKDAAGKELVKANDGKWYEKGKVDAEGRVLDNAAPTEPADLGVKLTTNDPAETPYEAQDPITKAVEDFKKQNPNASEEDIAAAKKKAIEANPTSKDTVTKGEGGVALNNVAWAEEPDQAVNKDQLDQTVNKSGFYVKQNGKSTVEANKGATDDAKTEKVTPNDVMDFVDGNNTKVSVTTDTESGRDVTKVKVNVVGLPMQYTKEDGTPVVKVGDKYYPVKEDGTPDLTTALSKDEEGKLSASVVNPTAKPHEKGKPVTLNNIKDNIGVNADGTTVADQTKGNPFAKPTTEDLKKIGNNAATVNDVMRAGWNAYVDSTDKANHKAVVNPTDNVVFKGENGISVTSDGETDGTTVFKFSLKTGEVTKSNEFVVTKLNEAPIKAIKVGEDYYKAEDIDATTGQPKQNASPINMDDAKVENKGAGFVTGNQVADAIQANGWTIGKANDKSKDEKVNPNDEVRFADGKNTIVSLDTVDAVDENGEKKTTTTIKVDVDLPIDYKYKDANGNEVVKGDDGKFYEIDKTTGKADKAKPVADQASVTKDGAKLIDNGNKPSYTVADPIAKAVEDFKQKNPNATEADIAAEREKAIKANPDKKDAITAGEGGVALNNVAWATNPDQAVNKDQLDQTVNKAGFYVKQNGKSTLAGKDSDKDVDTEKVTPNDIVNFVDGTNTKVVVTTKPEKGRDVTEVKVNVVDLPMQYTAKVNGKDVPVTKVGDDFFTVDENGNPTTTKVEPSDLSLSLISPNSAPNTTGDAMKLNNIADGEISSTSKQAVNGSQLYALTGGNKVDNKAEITLSNGTTITGPAVKGNVTINVKDDAGNITGTKELKNEVLMKTYNVENQTHFFTNSAAEAIYKMNEGGIKFFHVNNGQNSFSNQDTNKEDSSASGKYAAAIGFSAKARSNSTIAIGHGAVAGTSEKEGVNALAIGNKAQALGNNTISVGTGNIVAGNNSGAFGDPSYITDKDKDDGAVDGSYSIGNNNVINSSNTFVLGNNVNNKGTKDAEGRPEPLGNTVENSVYLGNKTTATAGGGIGTKNIDAEGNEGKTTTAGDKGTVTSANVNGLVYGGFAGDKANGVVSVGAAGSERRIQNVAAGEISETSTDAINGSQLYHVASKLGDISNQMNRNNKQHRAGIAGANAAAALPQVYIPGKSMVAASAGTYKGQSALAVGYSRTSDNGKLILKLQGNANSSGDIGAGVGLGYQW